MFKKIASFTLVFLCLTAILSCSPDTDRTTHNSSHIPASTDLSHLERNRSSVLVSSQWLHTELKKGEIKLIELGRTLKQYKQGHIPSAHYLDWRTDISDQSIPEMYNVLPQRDFEQLMSELGITKDDTIVLYDVLNSRAATRAYWTLKYYNHAHVKVLDGGLSNWQKKGYSLSNILPVAEISEYQVEQIQHSLLVDKLYIEHNLANDKMKLVDGRPFDQYTGEANGKIYNTGVAHQRGGHIYGAKTVPWADNLNEDGTFKSSEELFAIYAEHEVINQGIVVTYCNEGFHAAMPWFVLHELLGFEDVRLYDNSMAEWANVFDTPMKTGEHCM